MCLCPAIPERHSNRAGGGGAGLFANLDRMTAAAMSPDECDVMLTYFLNYQRAPTLDEGQITHLICARLKYDLYDFFRGCFWAFSTRKRTGSRPKTPPKKVI